LLVSYFASSVSDIFRRATVLAVAKTAPQTPILDEELQLTVADLRSAATDLPASIPDRLIVAKSLSFQDMQSIARTFKKYFEVDMAKTPTGNEVIVGQACRHVIVHTGGVVDDRLVRQVSGAAPRVVKPKLSVGEVLQFSPEEVELVAKAMGSYIGDLSRKTSERVGGSI